MRSRSVICLLPSMISDVNILVSFLLESEGHGVLICLSFSLNES